MKLLLFACLCLGVGVELRAEDAGPIRSRTRAALYQAQVRTTLIKHEWHVAAEAPGTLVLDHMLLSGGAGKTGYTRATIIFKSKGLKDTACSAFVLNYVDGYYLTADIKKYHGRVPTPSDPEIVKRVQDLINDAREELLREHPEFGP